MYLIVMRKICKPICMRVIIYYFCDMIKSIVKCRKRPNRNNMAVIR